MENSPNCVLLSMDVHAGSLTVGFMLSSGGGCEPVLLVEAFVAFVRLMHGVCHPCSSGTEEYLQSCSEKGNRTVHGESCKS